MPRLPKQALGRAVALAFGLLVACGVILGIAMDAGIVVLTPLVHALKHLPLVIRVIVYVVVGVPVGLGMAMYVLLELADLFSFMSRPFVWVGRLLRRD